MIIIIQKDIQILHMVTTTCSEVQREFIQMTVHNHLKEQTEKHSVAPEFPTQFVHSYF